MGKQSWEVKERGENSRVVFMLWFVRPSGQPESNQPPRHTDPPLRGGRRGKKTGTFNSVLSDLCLVVELVTDVAWQSTAGRDGAGRGDTISSGQRETEGEQV